MLGGMKERGNGRIGLFEAASEKWEMLPLSSHNSLWGHLKVDLSSKNSICCLSCLPRRLTVRSQRREAE